MRLERYLRSAFLEGVSLSAEELEQARSAFREVTIFKKRRQYWILNGILLVNFLDQAATNHHGWMKWSTCGMLIVVMGAGVYRWTDDRRLKNLYADNLELLRALGEREPGLSALMGDPFEYQPLLAAWNRRLSQRALLWRVDQFLSGRGWGNR